MKRKLNSVGNDQVLQNGNIPIKIDLLEDDLYSRKVQLLEKFKLILENHFLMEKSETPISDDLLNVIRIFHLSSMDLYFLNSSSSPTLSKISDWNELQVFKWFKKTLYELERAKILNKQQLETLYKAKLQISRLCKGFTSIHTTKNHTYNLIDSEEIKEFEQWVKKNGAEISNTKIVDFEVTGRGLLASKDIEEDSSIMCIPKTILIYDTVAYNSKIGHILKQMQIENEMATLLFLLYEKFNPESFWKPYFKVLPENFGTPLQFNFSELMELQETPIFYEIVESKEQIKNWQENMLQQLQSLAPNLFPKDSLTFEQFLWARSFIDSRGFILQIDEKPHLCLVPYADMLNHHPNGQVSFRRFDEEKECFVTETLSNIPRGNQIFLSYGGFANREQVLFYGFLNPSFDIVPITLEPPEESVEEKTVLLNSLGLSLNHFLHSFGGVSPSLLATLRICLIKPSDLQELVNKKINWFDPIPSIEEQVIETLNNLVDSLLQEYTTTVQEDEEQLQDASLTEHGKLGILYRISQKKVLHLSKIQKNV